MSAKARRRRRLPSTQGRDKSVIISSGCVDIGIRLGAEVLVTNGYIGEYLCLLIGRGFGYNQNRRARQ